MLEEHVNTILSEGLVRDLKLIYDHLNGNIVAPLDEIGSHGPAMDVILFHDFNFARMVLLEHFQAYYMLKMKEQDTEEPNEIIEVFSTTEVDGPDGSIAVSSLIDEEEAQTYKDALAA